MVKQSKVQEDQTNLVLVMNMIMNMNVSIPILHQWKQVQSQVIEGRHHHHHHHHHLRLPNNDNLQLETLYLFTAHHMDLQSHYLIYTMPNLTKVNMVVPPLLLKIQRLRQRISTLLVLQ
ncbi:unnamed protein product [[Candida] boidinii]|nr:unnamed protein product [[Candida] boidinii]